MLAAVPTASHLNFWQQWIYERLLKQFVSNACKLLGLLSATVKTLLGIKHLYKMKLVNTCLSEVLERICKEIRTLDDEQLKADTCISNAIIHAIVNGVLELVVRLTDADQRLFGLLDEKTDRNLITIAVQYRHEKLVSFLMQQTGSKYVVNDADKYGNSPLHMVGLLPPSSHLNIIPGPALQMQKELQWFQEVESLVENKILKNLPNDEGMTAREYFTKHHEELRKGGEKWMKETASSYSFVAALIVTITFAALIVTITFAAGYIVPGGGNDLRSLVHKKWFLVFIISDAASLFSSTTSVLMLLGIITSHFYEEAFLTSLPTKLILGMSALFFSIATMMICYCAALYEMLQGQLVILVSIILIASIPVYLFVSLQFPLLVDIFISTYRSGLGIVPKKAKKRRFFW